jgi:hypothetical protein
MKEMKVKIKYLARGESAYLKAKFCHGYDKISMI